MSIFTRRPSGMNDKVMRRDTVSGTIQPFLSKLQNPSSGKIKTKQYKPHSSCPKTVPMQIKQMYDASNIQVVNAHTLSS